MRRFRASARLAALVASLAMALGITLFAGEAAWATPNGPTRVPPGGYYPPPPPVLTVNKGVVRIHANVRVSGKKFVKKEKVAIVIRFLPKGSHHFRVVKVTTIRADKNGKFAFNIRSSKPGTIVISAVGKTSKKKAQTSVFVVSKKKGSGGIIITPAAFSSGVSNGGTPAVTPASDTSDITGLAIAGLGAMALAGSVVITRRTIRRRRAAASV
ncbi:hypothetical protein [Krasilnikovia sp. MM14-A1259]|uniref:hypothetical protein n=1 Tax=Krasilnikovia sp. MM14-A1259 TaxID=3373539 RepID=UPI0038160261